MNVDFQAFGRPTIPTSATNLSSIWTLYSSPRSQSSAKAGACRVADVKCAFPYPPRPHRHKRCLCPENTKSQRMSPVFTSFTIVPTGTFTIRSSHHLPVISFVPPRSPSSAWIFFRWRKSESVFSCGEASKMISPHFPPFPPNGQPFGIYFSRRQLTAPSPPFPAISRNRTSSINIRISKFKI